MTTKEARQVLALFRAGGQDSYGIYHARVWCTLCYDQEKGAFAVREQLSSSDLEYTILITEDERRQRLERGFQRSELD